MWSSAGTVSRFFRASAGHIKAQVILTGRTGDFRSSIGLCEQNKMSFQRFGHARLREWDRIASAYQVEFLPQGQRVLKQATSCLKTFAESKSQLVCDVLSDRQRSRCCWGWSVADIQNSIFSKNQKVVDQFSFGCQSLSADSGRSGN